jgi:hypothetical protein
MRKTAPQNDTRQARNFISETPYFNYVSVFVRASLTHAESVNIRSPRKLVRMELLWIRCSKFCLKLRAFTYLRFNCFKFNSSRLVLLFAVSSLMFFFFKIRFVYLVEVITYCCMSVADGP